MLTKACTRSLDKPWLDTKIRTRTKPNCVPKGACHTQQQEFKVNYTPFCFCSLMSLWLFPGLQLPEKAKCFGVFIKSLLFQALADFGRGSIRVPFAVCWWYLGPQGVEGTCSPHRRDPGCGFTTCCVWQQHWHNQCWPFFPFCLCQLNRLWNQVVNWPSYKKGCKQSFYSLFFLSSPNPFKE